jgi:hypothetical protein
MRHAAIAQGLLAPTMSLSSVRCALIPPPCFARERPVAQPPAPTAAVALASVVVDAHVECLAALEAGDLDEVELVRPGHAAGEADLDKIRGECKALSVTRPSFRLAASTARPLRQGGPGTPPHRA